MQPPRYEAQVRLTPVEDLSGRGFSYSARVSAREIAAWTSVRSRGEAMRATHARRGPVREVGAQVKLGQAAVRMAAGAGDVHSVEENLLNGGQRDAVALPEPAREPSD